MDILGKVYKDYFLKDLKLDGKSHQIPNYELGGIGNLINNEKILAKIYKNTKLNFFIFGDSSTFEKIYFDHKEFYNIFLIKNDINVPNALIIEKKNKRTSFIFNDLVIKVDNLNKQSDNCIIYYGDKIKFNRNIKYKNIYIDTAGNFYDDLYFDFSKNSKNIIISISQEYLTKDLKNFYLKINNAIIIAHKPKSAKIITLNGSETIPNDFFIDEKIEKITGLGDKFFLLVATYLESKKSKDIKKSIKYAHRELYLLIRNT